ncbi:GerAB/ArcD/ProY family transporter [Paenibacillus camerounensis]|uniref:GerAB/ArcD/ProY family transporter n=1 Tax=Paenibacillus camerounensis TaxID=1243663 RepID=UPI0012F9B3D4|nr:endospore germination permease [Paenibacillus camerounensis]
MTSRELCMLLTLSYWGSALLGLPSVLIGVSGSDAWLPILLGTGFQFLLIPVFTGIFKQMNGNTVGQYLNRILGRWIGKGLLAVYLFFVPFQILVLTLRSLGDFTSTDLYIETPPAAIYIIILFAMVYCLHKGISAVAKSTEITFPIAGLLLVVLLLSLLHGAEWNRLLPFLDNGAGPVLHGTTMFIGYPNSEIALSLFLAPFIQSKQTYRKALWQSSILTGLGLLFLTIMVTVVLGENLPPNIPYASQFAAKTVTVGGFYERIETAVTVIWFIVMFYRMIFTFYICAHGLADLFGLKQHFAFLIPLALLCIPLAMLVWDNPSVTAEITAVWPTGVIFFNILLPLSWLILGKIKGRPVSK